MSAALAEHDRLVAGRDPGRPPGQVRQRDEAARPAEAQITAARAERDGLVQTVDVSVLDQWLERNQTYDVALRALYKEISRSARRSPQRRRPRSRPRPQPAARLPPDTRGLIIIMSEIGRGGMNGAVIAIEEARAKLTDAIDAGTAAPSDAPEPTGGA